MRADFTSSAARAAEAVFPPSCSFFHTGAFERLAGSRASMSEDTFRTIGHCPQLPLPLVRESTRTGTRARTQQREEVEDSMKNNEVTN